MLSDPDKRAQYDRFGAVGNGAGHGRDFGFDPGSFGDIFDMFFGNVRSSAQTRHAGPQRGSDLRYDLEISLEEAFAGTSKEIEFYASGAVRGVPRLRRASRARSSRRARRAADPAPCAACARRRSDRW